MESNGEAGRVVISENTYHRVRNKLECEHRGPIEGKNKGVLETYFVNSSMPSYGPH